MYIFYHIKFGEEQENLYSENEAQKKKFGNNDYRVIDSIGRCDI